MYDRDRRVVGLPGWTERQPPTDKNLEVWAAEPDYGICIRTGGGLVAIDIDVADPVKASAIRDFVSSVISTLLAEGDDDSDDFLLPPLVPVRWRENSGKCLIPVIVEGPQAKRRIEVDDGVVEILGDGQQ